MAKDKASVKMAWLQSQLVGSGFEFKTPFGSRPLVYADHTASGRSLHYIEDFIAGNVLPRYGNSHTSDSHVGGTMTKMVREATTYVKKCLGGGPEDALLFCGSGATAAIKRLQEVMGLAVAPTLRDRVRATMREEEKWVVFVGPYEHHSNLLSWRNSLAEVVEVGTDKDGLIDVVALESELGSSKYSNRPMLGSFSACSNVTGTLTDTRGLARVLHCHGAFACFDFAASGPYVKLDLRSGEIDGYDAVFLSPHKFLGGPGTPGVLLMSKALYRLNSSPPSTCGGGTVAYVNGFSEEDTLYHEDIEEREDAGTPPIIQKIRTALTFWVKEFIGHRLIKKQEDVYIDAALNRLRHNKNVQILGSTEAKRLPILSFLVFPNSAVDEDGWVGKRSAKPLHGRFVAKVLNDLFGVQARGGCACAGPYGHHLLGIDVDLSRALRSAIHKGYDGLKPGWTRVSFSYYMPKEEFVYVLTAIEFVTEHGHRLLPLYCFDWRSGNWTFRKQALQDELVEKDIISHALDDMSIGSTETAATGNSGNSTIKESDEALKDLKSNKIVSKFESHLEAAKRIVSLLPLHRSATKIPDYIDANLVLFEI